MTKISPTADQRRFKRTLVWMLTMMGNRRISGDLRGTKLASSIARRVWNEIAIACRRTAGDGSNSTARLMAANALPTRHRSIVDVEIPDPGYRGEPNPSPPPTDGGG